MDIKPKIKSIDKKLDIYIENFIGRPSNERQHIINYLQAVSNKIDEERRFKRDIFERKLAMEIFRQFNQTEPQPEDKKTTILRILDDGNRETYIDIDNVI